MAKLDASAIAALKAANPLAEIIERGGVRLGRANGKGIRAFPCLCDPQRGKTPCWVDVNKHTWGCLRSGGSCGGDTFEYLKQIEGLDFVAAVERLGGRVAQADPETKARMERERRERLARQEKLDAETREKHRARAWEIYRCGVPAMQSVVWRYLEGRGLDPRSPAAAQLKLVHDMPYWFEVDGKVRAIHTGPAMLAAIQGADDRFLGVHITWLATDGSGKARIVAPDGTECKAKKFRGLAAGGAIRLTGKLSAGILLIGEGIETTLAVYDALRRARPDLECAAWAAASLNNLGGGGRGLEPDMDRPGFLPPPWAQKIILLGDGDSDPENTRTQLERGRRRCSRLGFAAAVAMAEKDKDFNDMLRGL